MTIQPGSSFTAASRHGNSNAAFLLAEGIEVLGADLDNGLLHVSLKRPVVETHSRTIEIKTGGKSKRPNLKEIDIEPEGKAS